MEELEEDSAVDMSVGSEDGLVELEFGGFGSFVLVLHHAGERDGQHGRRTGERNEEAAARQGDRDSSQLTFHAHAAFWHRA
ncbi:hypothetical protein [Umezawaea tangerina]|uniref:hypothetical protein n=1 Tax=Umezawaea tangerina TaxID=84725 RepID=UPI0011B1E17F|nr:hypothetical protein [Umezawaea tangerina]